MGLNNKSKLSALALASILATAGATAPVWSSGSILTKHSIGNKPWLRKKKGRS